MEPREFWKRFVRTDFVGAELIRRIEHLRAIRDEQGFEPGDEDRLTAYIQELTNRADDFAEALGVE